MIRISFWHSEYRDDCAKNAAKARIDKQREAYKTLKTNEKHPDYEDWIINREFTV